MSHEYGTRKATSKKRERVAEEEVVQQEVAAVEAAAPSPDFLLYSPVAFPEVLDVDLGIATPPPAAQRALFTPAGNSTPSRGLFTPVSEQLRKALSPSNFGSLQSFYFTPPSTPSFSSPVQSNSTDTLEAGFFGVTTDIKKYLKETFANTGNVAELQSLANEWKTALEEMLSEATTITPDISGLFQKLIGGIDQFLIKETNPEAYLKSQIDEKSALKPVSLKM